MSLQPQSLGWGQTEHHEVRSTGIDDLSSFLGSVWSGIRLVEWVQGFGLHMGMEWPAEVAMRKPLFGLKSEGSVRKGKF